MSEPDDDDLDWEEWLELSGLGKMLDRMRIARARASALRTCLNWRKMIRDHGFEFGRTYLRDAQVLLLKLRIWRATGQYPGEA